MMLRRQKTALLAALICILFAGLIFFYNNIVIPRVSRQVEQTVREKVDVNAMPRKKVVVVSDKNGISKYTVLTDEIANGKLKLVDVPVEFAAEGSAIDIDMVRGKITKEDLRYGEQVSMDSLSVDKKWFGDYDRLKEYEVKSIVAGEVKSGNIVDIAVSYGNGRYDVVVPKVKVRKLIKETDKEKNEDRYTVIISVDEVMYRDLELAKKLGNLVTRLYLDESQPPSKKTFDYSKKSGVPLAANEQDRPARTLGLVE